MILKPLPAYALDSKFQTDIELGLLPGSQTPVAAAPPDVAPESTCYPCPRLPPPVNTS